MKARKMTKLIGMFLAAVMMLAVLGTLSVVPAFAADPAYSGGSGTADDPYLLSTPEDLVALSEAIANDDGSLDAADTCGLGMYHGYYFELTQDIDMTGIDWTPMSFCGNLDGKGFAIKNLDTTATDNGDGEYWTGFFAQLINATVSNVTFDNCVATVADTVSSSRDIYATIVAANAIASKLENIRIVDCTITNHGTAHNFGYAGFVAALADISNITGCTVEGGSISAITPTSSNLAGGIVGCFEDMFYEFIADYGNPYNMVIGAGSTYGIYDCVVDTEIAYEGKFGYASGIVGMTCTDYLDADVPEQNGMAVEIKNCIFDGDITVTSANGYASGISGWDEPEDVLDGCVNLGTLTATKGTFPLGTHEEITIQNSYYVADAEDGNGGYTAEQFANGVVCTARGGHTVLGDATCKNPAVCALCGIADGSHNAGDAYDYDGTHHWLLCADCGEAVDATKEAHDGAEECSVCGWEYRTPEELYAEIQALDAAIKALENAVEQGNADIAAEIQELILQVKLAQNALKADSQANKLELSKMLTDATGALEVAVATLTTRLDTAEGNIDEMLTAIAAAQSALEVLQDVSVTKDEMGAEVEKLEKAIEDLESALTQAKTDLQDAIDKVAADLKNAKDAYDKAVKDLNQAIADLDAAVQKGDKTLADKITAVEKALAAAEAAAKAADEDLSARLTTAKESPNNAIKAVQKNLDDAKATLKAAIASGDDNLATKIATLNGVVKDLEDTLAAAEAALKGADDKNKSELEAVIKSVQTALKTAMEEGDKANADALAAEVALLREEIAQSKKDAQIVPIVIACISIVGNIAVLWVVILKRKRFMGMTVKDADAK